MKMSAVHRTIVVVTLAAWVASTAPAVAATDIKPKPGYWEVGEIATLLSSAKKVEHRCLVSSEITKFMNRPSNRHYDSTYPTPCDGGWAYSAERLLRDEKGQVAHVTAQGICSPNLQPSCPFQPRFGYSLQAKRPRMRSGSATPVRPTPFAQGEAKAALHQQYASMESSLGQLADLACLGTCVFTL